MATRRQIRNRAFLIALAAWTIPAIALALYFVLYPDQKGHPPAAFLAFPVALVWVVGATILFAVWAIVGLRDR